MVHAKSKLLIFIVAYNAEKTIESVLTRIPNLLHSHYDLEVLIIDDSSTDDTFQKSIAAKEKLNFGYPITILRNPVNQGYGGNQKIGYHYAIINKFDYVALIHGDGQYAPEALPELMLAFSSADSGAVFGSRMMMAGNALKGGMPIYKYIGNKVLTSFENFLLGTSYSEFHSGYRIYAVSALEQVPFDLNTNDFHFDTEIIIQFVARRLKIIERPIPTYYGDEICRVNGIKYAFDVAKSVLLFKAQSLGIFYDRRYDLQGQDIKSNEQYLPKLIGTTPHSLSLKKVASGSRVVDIGCAAAYVGALLESKKNCLVLGLDVYDHPQRQRINNFVLCNLSEELPEAIELSNFQYILLLDIIEHLLSPEKFLQSLSRRLEGAPSIRLLVSTGNVGFIVIRLMLLLGQFNYGKRGILDITHTRLFTFASMRRLLDQSGFEVIEEIGIPAPFELLTKNASLIQALDWLNRVLIRFSKGLFSYQMYLVVKARPTLSSLLGDAYQESKEKTNVAS